MDRAKGLSGGVGTPAWIGKNDSIENTKYIIVAPEMFTKSVCTEKADVYSFAIGNSSCHLSVYIIKICESSDVGNDKRRRRTI
jgi:hypothetical protein